MWSVDIPMPIMSARVPKRESDPYVNVSHGRKGSAGEKIAGSLKHTIATIQIGAPRGCEACAVATNGPAARGK